MPPDYGWWGHMWGPMWFFPMVMPIVMLVVLIALIYLIFGRGGFGPLGTDRPGIMTRPFRGIAFGYPEAAVC